MKRAWKIRDAVQSEMLLLQRCTSKSKTLRPTAIIASSNFSDYCFTRETSTQAHHPPEPKKFPPIVSLFANKLSRMEDTAKEDLKKKVLQLQHELVSCADESHELLKVLKEKGKPLFLSYSDGSACVELLRMLYSKGRLAIEVFNWRRKLAEDGVPMTSEEFSKGIKIAARNQSVDLALELFQEAARKRILTTSTYNALMSAYMWNGLADKCRSVFFDLKKDENCIPSIVTYNILLSVYGRLMLFDHMEATLDEIKALKLSPNIITYNNLIRGYLTAWMWDSMDKTFWRMKAGAIKPDIHTYFLMLRGYAHSGNLEKMEEIYELVKHQVNGKCTQLITTMVCAYVKSSRTDRIERIHDLIKLIPGEEYRPWLNVLLINVFAEEDWLEGMESSINEAFERETVVTAVRVMRSIGASYFRCNAVDRLSVFVKRAESAGWRICRSLYHAMMIMYGRQGDLEQMENALEQMENVNIVLTKKTCWIMFGFYSKWGQRHKANQVIGLMYKHGYEISPDVYPL